MFYAVINLKIVNFYKPWSNMKILMLFHDFDVIDLSIMKMRIYVTTKNIQHHQNSSNSSRKIVHGYIYMTANYLLAWYIQDTLQ
jgi:hypothetical protein